MGATRLDENTAWINLATLALTENQITYEGEKALSLNAAWAALNSLQFGGNVGTKGIFALSKNRNWRGLKTLSLKDNLIGDKGVRHIIINNDFSGNNVNASSLFALAHHQPWRHLRKLSLSSNAIDLEGVKYLSLIPQWGNLKLLDLSYNMISDDGAKALCNYAKFQKLKTLNLRKNGISYEGVKSLSKNASLVKLEILDLTENKIDSKSTKTMAKIFQHWKNLQLLFEVKEEDNVQEGIQTEGRDVAETPEEKTSQLNVASHLKSIFKLGREKEFEECDAISPKLVPKSHCEERSGDEENWSHESEISNLLCISNFSRNDHNPNVLLLPTDYK